MGGVRVLLVAALLVLAGCFLPQRTEHKVGVWNATPGPIDVRVVVTDLASGEVVLERDFRALPQNGESVEHAFAFDHPYFLNATWGNVTGGGEFRMHSGSWYVTAYVSAEGVSVSTLHGD